MPYGHNLSASDQTSQETNTHYNTDTHQEFHPNEWIGKYQQIKPQNTFRLLFHNVNSLGGKEAFSNSIPRLMNEQVELNIDMQGITEHCLNLHHQNTKMNIHNAVRYSTQTKTAHQFDSGIMYTTNEYLPGGTALIVSGKAVGRIAPKGTGGDRMGRWSYIQLLRNNRTKITVITAYQVNPLPTNTTGTAAWHQQRLQLDGEERTSITPRAAFIEDLTRFIKEQQQEGCDILLGGDFNETTDKQNSGILQLLMNTNLADPWTYLYPELPTFNSHSEGSSRIDAIYCSHTLLNSIESYGYAPWDWITNSDHRPMIIDFNGLSLFCGTTNGKQNISQTRLIKSNDPKHVKIFIEAMYNHLDMNNAFNLALRVKNNEANNEDIETLDRLIGQAGQSAENKCKKRRPEFYSQTLSQLRLKKSIAYAHYRNLKNRSTRRQQGLLDRIKRANLQMTLSQNLQDTYAQYKTYCTAITEALRKSRELREEEQRLIEILKTNPNDKKAKKVRGIRIKEQERRNWKTWNFVKAQSGSKHQELDRVDIPTSWPSSTSAEETFYTIEDPKKCDQWTSITNPHEIDFYIRIRNRKHFGQSQGTPFTIPPLSNDLNWEGNTDICNEILEGGNRVVQYKDNLHDVPQCMSLLQSCKSISDLDHIPYEITPQQFEGKIKSWRETTTTSPSMRHLGWYKSLYSRSDYKEPEAIEAFKDKQTKIQEIILAIINHCLNTGYVMDRWKTIINAMIFKDNGNFKIHRLRVIHIYEADFNLILAVKWQQLLKYADSQRTINPGLFGGRPGCEAQSLTLLEELKYDISYASRRSLFNFDNDASSCYDRIVLNLASIINRKYGMHQKATTLHAKTLKEARFHLRTAQGTSPQSYTHSQDYPIYGSGQGSGNSPCIWLLISSTLCDTHNSLAHGSTFISPDEALSVKMSMVGYVDDCTGTLNDFRPQEEHDHNVLSTRMQSDAQIWNDLLWASGGMLELPKCSYHSISFDFKPDGTPIPIQVESDPISINDPVSNQPIPINQKDLNEPHKTLGHWKAPRERKGRTQLSSLLEKAQRNSTLIATNSITRLGAFRTYIAVYIQALRYVLPQCHFEPQQLDRCESKTISIILSKCGYNRNISKALRYAPTQYGGCGFIPWTVLQSEGQICLFLKHWRTDSIVSRVLRISLAWAQKQTGFSLPLLEEPYTVAPHLETRWLTSLRKALADNNGQIIVDEPFLTFPECKGDIHIMDWIVHNPDYTEKDVKILNYCRLYLNISTISELFDEHGERMLPYMYQCLRPAWFHPEQYIIIQRRPSQIQINRRWKTFCHQWCQPKTLIRKANLGDIERREWLPSNINRPYRQSYMDKSTNPPTLYHFHGNNYWKLTPSPPNQHRTYALSMEQLDSRRDLLHPQITPTFITTNPFTCCISSNSPTFIHSPLQCSNYEEHHNPIVTDTPVTATTIANPITPEPGETFKQYINGLPQWQQQCLTSTNMLFTPSYIIGLIRQECNNNKPITIITFSYRNETALITGWAIITSNGSMIAANGRKTFYESPKHRSAVWSILSAILFLEQVHKCTQDVIPPDLSLNVAVTEPNIAKRMNQRPDYTSLYPNTTLEADWDLTETIHQLHSQLLQKAPFFYCPSKKAVLPLLPGGQQPILITNAQLKKFRTEAASIAKGAQACHEPILPLLPTTKCQLFLNSQVITSDYTQKIREAATLPSLCQYLQQKSGWDSTTLKNINWYWQNEAIRTYRGSTHNHLVKLIHRQLATPAQKWKMGGCTWTNPICPHCNHGEDETFDHMLRCNLPEAVHFRSNLIKKVQTYTPSWVPQRFSNTLQQALQSWLQPYNPNIEGPDESSEITNIRAKQTTIGWDMFIRGYMSSDWILYLTYEIKFLNPNNNIKYNMHKFFIGLIQQMWYAQSEFWQSYQETRHSSNTTTSLEHITKRAELQATVRHLLSLRPQLDPSHSDHYFPQDPEAFIADGTNNHLQNYINNYGNIIRKAAKQRYQRSLVNIPRLSTFEGFNIVPRLRTRVTRANTTTVCAPRRAAKDQPLRTLLSWLTHLSNSPTTPTNNCPTNINNIPQNRLPFQRRILHQISTEPPPPILRTLPAPQEQTGATTNHKHSRWRPMSQVRQQFRAFFNPPSVP